MAHQPISNVIWRKREELLPNLYNPNAVAPPELTLLKTSILEDGWTSAIIITPENEIIDGFHRWTVSGLKDIYKLTDGMVPTVTKQFKSLAEKMSTTVRMNRARGTHAVLKMADIVEKMLKDGLAPSEIMILLGMEDEEIVRLANRKGVKVHIQDADFGHSWDPG